MNDLFALSLKVKQFYLTQIGSFQVLLLWPEWIWERWQWRGTLHSQKLKHHWSLTIRLFSVIPRILMGGGGGLPVCRDAAGVFYSLSRLGLVVLSITLNFKCAKGKDKIFFQKLKLKKFFHNSCSQTIAKPA